MGPLPPTHPTPSQFSSALFHTDAEALLRAVLTHGADRDHVARTLARQQEFFIRYRNSLGHRLRLALAGHPVFADYLPHLHGPPECQIGGSLADGSSTSASDADVLVRLNLKIVKQPESLIVSSRSFSARRKARSNEFDDVAAAFDDALGRTLREAVIWTVQEIDRVNKSNRFERRY